MNANVLEIELSRSVRWISQLSSVAESKQAFCRCLKQPSQGLEVNVTHNVLLSMYQNISLFV